MQQKPDAEQQRIRKVALLACLAVVAAMFLGAILTGVASLEMDKEQTSSGAMKSDQP